MRSLGKRAERVAGFFGCLYYGGMRPSEAADLRLGDCVLPANCLDCGATTANALTLGCAHDKVEYQWGKVTLAETTPLAGSHWTDDGQPYERRGLKHRARKETRAVPSRRGWSSFSASM